LLSDEFVGRMAPMGAADVSRRKDGRNDARLVFDAA
jgi:hypothetical protein